MLAQQGTFSEIIGCLDTVSQGWGRNYLEAFLLVPVGVDPLCLLGGLLEHKEEWLWEGLMFWDQWECPPGKHLDLHLLLGQLCLDLGLLSLWGNLPDNQGNLALLTWEGQWGLLLLQHREV